jgi:glycosyltransferase involved in cell wall biosynthesis
MSTNDTIPEVNDTVSVIIPVYNEVRTISSVIEIVNAWGRASEIIIVNDGSSDHTHQAIAQFLPTIDYVSYAVNRGKGYALAKGIEKSSGDILMFLDGDLVGLTKNDLDKMLAPVLSAKADMVIGVARFLSVGSIEPFNEISGERVVLRKNVIGVVDRMRKVGYGVELLINDLHKTKRVVSVRLPYVFILKKVEKQSATDAALSFVKEARELASQLVRQQTDGIVTPQAKRVYHLISKYLKQAIDYLG